MWEAKGFDGSVAFDGKRVRISHGGAMAALTGRQREESVYPLSSVSGVELKRPGATRGRFTLVVRGGRQRRAGWMAHRKDPLSVEFSRGGTVAFAELSEAIRDALASAGSPGGDPLARLDHLRQARDRGLISVEEFESKRRRIIDEI